MYLNTRIKKIGLAGIITFLAITSYADSTPATAESIVAAINSSLHQQVKQTALAPSPSSTAAPIPSPKLPVTPSSAVITGKAGDPASTQKLLEKMTHEFTLQSSANRPLVRERIAAYLSHKERVIQKLATAQPYLTQVYSAIHERHLPTELALLPILDSAQSPLVTDNKAALDKLTALHAELGDWLLAVAAYHGGIGPVQSALQKNPATTFWKLNLPQPTQLYVANWIALTQLIKYPSYYDLSW